MDEQFFWCTLARAKAECGGDHSRQVELVAEQLCALPPAEIEIFEKIFQAFQSRSYRIDLWRAMNDMVGSEGLSDEHFPLFRAWLIGEGREAFRAVTQQPTRLPEFLPQDKNWLLEDLSEVGEKVYKEKTGLDLWTVLIEQGAEPYTLVGWEWLQADEIGPDL